MSATQSAQLHSRALVTGASSGIGEAFVERLARDGWDLVLVARSGPALETLAKELGEAHGVDIEVEVADLTDAAALRRVETLVAGRPLDLLVNNAGMGTSGAFAGSDVEREEQEIQLNVTALMRLTRAALPGMIERGSGAVINVSSLAGMGPYPYTAVYGASKAFVNSFSEALVEELRGTGVKVQALCPGFTRTRFQERAGVDPSTVPGFAWMEAESVVDASLASLEKGEVISVPGLGYRVLSWVGSAAPRGVFRRVIGAAQASRYRSDE
jgi:short-subunit dehydrogenase